MMHVFDGCPQKHERLFSLPLSVSVSVSLSLPLRSQSALLNNSRRCASSFNHTQEGTRCFERRRAIRAAIAAALSFQEQHAGCVVHAFAGTFPLCSCLFLCVVMPGSCCLSWVALVLAGTCLYMPKISFFTPAGTCLSHAEGLDVVAPAGGAAAKEQQLMLAHAMMPGLCTGVCGVFDL